MPLPLPSEISQIDFCKEVSPFVNGVNVYWPVGQVAGADFVLLPGLLDGDSERAVFGNPNAFEVDNPGLSLGYDSNAERSASERWVARLSQYILSPGTRFHPEFRARAVQYAKLARNALNEARGIYSKIANTTISVAVSGGSENRKVPLSKPDDEIYFKNALDRVVRAKAREDIRSLYSRAAHLLWCADYLRALSAARKAYEERPIDLPLAQPDQLPPGEGQPLPGEFYMPPGGVGPGNGGGTQPGPGPGMGGPSDNAPIPGDGCDPLAIPPTGYICEERGDGFRLYPAAPPETPPAQTGGGSMGVLAILGLGLGIGAIALLARSR